MISDVQVSQCGKRLLIKRDTGSLNPGGDFLVVISTDLLSTQVASTGVLDPFFNSG